MTPKSLAVLPLLCIGVTTVDLYAQRNSVEYTQEAEPIEDSISGSFGVDFTSQYFFRGILQENQNIIAQPWFELGFNLDHGDGPLRSVDLTFGIWNSLHSGPTGTGSKTATGPSMWYESDFYAGISADVGDAFNLSAVYTVLDSPNSSFSTVEEIALGVSYDDSSLWDGFSGLQPSLIVAFETDGQADGGSGNGTFLELSVSPEFTLREDDTTPITLTVPVAMAFSLHDYYEDATGDDESFGYFDLGAEVGMPMSMVAPRFGDWSMTVGLHLLWLGHSNEALNSGDDFEVIGSMGFKVDF